jgi:hypothetical protein
MAPRPDLTRGLLTPAAEDLSALAATGEDPTVQAFALGSRNGRVVYEVLNRPEPMTFVYRADGPDGLARINRALDDVGFQAAAVHAAGLTAPSQKAGPGQLLVRSPLGQVPHDAVA